MVWKIYATMLVPLVTGCAVDSPYDRCYVSRGIELRTDYELGQAAEPGQWQLPEGVSFDDGLSEDEAVALALWNNAQFQADLAALGFARADLIEANMLANPVFSLFFPVGPKLLETSLDLPIDVLWQRPHRIAASEYDAQGLAENLVEHGLGLIRDVQTTYADLWSARQEARLAGDEAQIRAEMAALAQKRLSAGDVSELVASAAQVDSLRAADTAQQLLTEATVLEQRLKALLGLISEDASFGIIAPNSASRSLTSVDELLETALAARPDLRAAELAIEAAGKRVGWERSKIYNLIAVIDGKDKGEASLTVGPGLQIEVPIFNQNQGKITRAQAELEQAARQYEVVRQTVILEVKEAHARYVSACEALDLWRGDVVPSLGKASEQVHASYAAGDVSYLVVLEAKQKLLGARLRQTELAAQLCRSAAQLNYCVGRRMI